MQVNRIRFSVWNLLPVVKFESTFLEAVIEPASSVPVLAAVFFMMTLGFALEVGDP